MSLQVHPCRASNDWIEHAGGWPTINISLKVSLRLPPSNAISQRIAATLLPRLLPCRAHRRFNKLDSTKNTCSPYRHLGNEYPGLSFGVPWCPMVPQIEWYRLLVSSCSAQISDAQTPGGWAENFPTQATQPMDKKEVAKGHAAPSRPHPTQGGRPAVREDRRPRVPFFLSSLNATRCRESDALGIPREGRRTGVSARNSEGIGRRRAENYPSSFPAGAEKSKGARSCPSSHGQKSTSSNLL